MKKDFRLQRLRKILQRLKSLILRPLSPTQRAALQLQLQQLDISYSNQEISFDQYKIKSIALLAAHWHDVSRTEQFLYRETGNFLTQAEKWQICDIIAP